jgi:hypothetical protein
MVTVKPSLPAHLRCCASFSVAAGLGQLANASIADNSSIFHVLPMLKLPFAFSRALCIITLPVDRTAIIIKRGLRFSAGLSGGGGDDGCNASSWMRMCVM